MDWGIVIELLSKIPTNLVSILVTIPFIISMAWVFGKYKYTHATASTVTVLGVLGTFVGITIGLIWFDPNNIRASVPLLLEGLKVAFFTSIVGMALAVYIKTKIQRKAREDEEKPYEGATVDDLANLLDKIQQGQEHGGNLLFEQLQKIENTLAGEGEGSVVTQLQKLRTSINDKQDELLNAFRTFAEDMAENNSKALIAALEEVMRDFNAKINEQFGDNFKRLNEAVENILVWQERYREQVDEMCKQFDACLNGVQEVRDSISEISERSKVLVDASEKLEEILKAVSEQREMIEKGLDGFADLTSKAQEAFPIIEERLNTLTNQFGESVSATIDSVKRTSDDIEDFTRRNASRIEEQLAALDKALEDELTKSISSLGAQLTSLSEKFVEDYSPLTEKLADVIRIAEGGGYNA